MHQSELELLSQAIASVYDMAIDPGKWAALAALAAPAVRHRGQFLSPSTEALLQCHIARAQQLRNDLARLRLDQLLQESALNAIAVGVLITDAGGRPLHVTRVAQHLLQTGRGVLLREGRVEAAMRSLTQKLREQVERVAVELSGDSAPEKRYLSIPMPDGSAVQLYIAPLPPDVKALGLDQACALIYCHDTRALHYPLAEALEHLFHLTPAESQVAEALVRGTSLKRHAEQRRLSIHTVKNQLKSVFEKTGHASQIDFVHDVLTNPLIAVANLFPPAVPVH